MVVVFFNTKSIGDVFFATPFIKFICENNKNYQFQIHTDIASFLYKNIENLSMVDDNPPDHPIHNTISKFFQYHENNPIIFDNDGNLFINTWVAPMNGLIKPNNCECAILQMYTAYKVMIANINEKLERKILFPEMKPTEMIYKMPPLEIDQFLAFKLSRNRQTVYYHNRIGSSASTKPFTKESDHIYILNKLASMFPEKDFIVPNAKAIPLRENVFTTKIFGIEEDHTCQNVLKDIDIAGHSDYAVTFDIGSCLIYCNNRYGDYKAKFLHLSHTDRYAVLLKKNIQDCLSISQIGIEYLHAKTPDEVIFVLQSRFK
jgi:hypothetical protein